MKLLKCNFDINSQTDRQTSQGQRATEDIAEEWDIKRYHYTTL